MAIYGVFVREAKNLRRGLRGEGVVLRVINGSYMRHII